MLALPLAMAVDHAGTISRLDRPIHVCGPRFTSVGGGVSIGLFASMCPACLRGFDAAGQDGFRGETSKQSRGFYLLQRPHGVTGHEGRR